MAAVEGREAGRGQLVRRRFWCAWSRRDVEMEFVVRGLPGLGPIVGVHSCSTFDPPTAIECRRRCVDPAFRRHWEPALGADGRLG